jgi:hypothetical protein
LHPWPIFDRSYPKSYVHLKNILRAAPCISSCIIVAALASCNHNTSTTQTSVTDSGAAIQTQPQAPVGNWKGTWDRLSEWQSGASLEIASVTGDKLSFHLLATNGGHIGDLEEEARVTGNIAVYRYTDEYDTCLVRFQLLGDSVIVVSQESGNCGSGAGVSFDGRYRNKKLGGQKEKEEDLLSLGVFTNRDDDDRFRALTKNHYRDFVSTTQITGEEDDLDGFGAKVQTSAVRGLYTEMEHIIMTDSSNRIWAAVVNTDTVRYFTNARLFADKLPKTIENWRENFKDKPVVFQSKK